MRYHDLRHIMGTEVEIMITTERNPKTDIQAAFDIFSSFEEEFSRFSETSSLSLLNKERTRKVSDRFIAIVQQTKKNHADTQWYFNPLINVAQKWYSKSFDTWDFTKTEWTSDTDIEKLLVTENTITLGKNQQLDLWWIVKWVAVDEASEYLKKQWYQNFIVNAGGDIFTAGKASEDMPRIIWIDNPFDQSKVIATLRLKDKAIATSGRYKRHWKIWENQYHHIINPWDNTNKTEIISISVIHPQCTTADSYATACFNMGIKENLDFLEKNGMEWLVVSSTGEISTTPWMKNHILTIL